MKIRMPQSRRGHSAAAAAVEAQSSSDEPAEAEPRPKQGKTGEKKSDKTACAAALEELESLNHEAASISKNQHLPKPLLPKLLLLCNQTHVTLMPHQNGLKKWKESGKRRKLRKHRQLKSKGWLRKMKN